MVPVIARRTPAASRGFTLVELLVGVVLGGVVAAALCRLLQDSQRFYRSQAQVVGVQQGLRAVAHVLASELRELDARDGDLVAIGPDSVTIRAQRTFAVVCAPPDPDGGSVVLADVLTFETREPDPARDRALVLADGERGEASAEADEWLDFGVAGVSAGKVCADGSPGTSVRLAGDVAALARVPAGAPVRTYERTTYRLYADEDGIAWLGERHLTSAAWSALSPVAGPLSRGDGLAFAWRDSAGTEVTTPAAVSQVDIVVRGLSNEPISIPGRRATGRRYFDSLGVHVALRNN